MKGLNFLAVLLKSREIAYYKLQFVKLWLKLSSSQKQPVKGENVSIKSGYIPQTPICENIRFYTRKFTSNFTKNAFYTSSRKTFSPLLMIASKNLLEKMPRKW